MRNFFSRMMYGRYGNDQLNTFLLIVFIVLWIVSAFVRVAIVASILNVLSWIAIFYALFRMMSRNYSRRHQENEAFMKAFGPIAHWFKRKRSQSRDKDHVYFKCPNCSQTLRVPKGRGKISITCRNCGTVFQEKT